MSSDEIILEIIRFLIKGKQSKIEEYDQYYLFIEDSYSYFDVLDTSNSISILDKTFSISKLNYINEFDIEDIELVEEITDENYSVVFFRFGKDSIKEAFEEENYDILNFSVLNLLILIFNFELDQEVQEKIQIYNEKFLEEEIFYEFLKSVKFFSNYSDELAFLKDLNFENFFDILFMFFSKNIFSDVYSNKIKNKLEIKKNKYVFEDSSPSDLIEMLFYVKSDEYNPELIKLCFEFMNLSDYNDDFKIIIEIVKLISGNSVNLQNFLQNIFLIDLFQFKCGRGSFRLNQSHLDSFNRKSNYTLKNIFEELNQFCVFTENYVNLLTKPEFREYIKTKFVKDFEIKYENENADFKEKHLNSITIDSLFNLDNQTYFFYKSYNKWIKTFGELIFNNLIENIKQKYVHSDLDFSNIKRNIEYYLQNLPRIEVFYHYNKFDKKIIENLLLILKTSIDIINEISNKENNSLDYWQKSSILEKIYNNDMKYREIREIYVHLDNQNPIFELLTDNIDKDYSFLIFNDFINHLCLQHFCSLIKSKYVKIIQAKNSALLFTNDIPLLIRDEIINNPGLKIILILVDGLRYDMWGYVWKALLLKFHLELEKRIKIFSLLPSITEVSRESMYFNDINTKFATPKQIEENLKKIIKTEKIRYIPLNTSREIIGGNLQKKIGLKLDLNIIMTPYPDHRIHQIENSEDLYNDTSFYSIVNDIKSHLEGIFEAIFHAIKSSEFQMAEFKIIITSDHGFIDYFKEIPYHVVKPGNKELKLKEMSRYLKSKEEFRNVFNFNQDDLSKLFHIPIGNQEKDHFIIPCGRNYFLERKRTKKSKKNIGHGGISFYENIIPFYKFTFIKAKRQSYFPQIIFINKDEILLNTKNQIKFIFSNQDQNYPIKILSYNIISKDGLIRKEGNFEKENKNEGILLCNRSSRVYHLTCDSYEERFKLYYTIFYSFIDEEGKETIPIPLKGEEEFIPQVVQNPEVKVEREKASKKDGIIKERFYPFQIEIYNPNNFPLENIQIILESSEEIQLEIGVFKKIKNIFLKKIEPNQRIERKILINFCENCKMDLKVRGLFVLPNLISQSFNEHNKLHLDVFKSESELNKPIFHL